MKVFEVLQKDVPDTSLAQLEEKLKTFDWLFDVSDDFKRYAMGKIQLELLENQVYRLWKAEPERAVKLWNDNCQPRLTNPPEVPSFINRLQLQESDK